MSSQNQERLWSFFSELGAETQDVDISLLAFVRTVVAQLSCSELLEMAWCPLPVSYSAEGECTTAQPVTGPQRVVSSFVKASIEEEQGLSKDTCELQIGFDGTMRIHYFMMDIADATPTAPNCVPVQRCNSPAQFA